MSDETEETIRRYVATIAELRKENERQNRICAEYSSAHETLHATIAEIRQQLAEANKRLAEAAEILESCTGAQTGRDLDIHRWLERERA